MPSGTGVVDAFKKPLSPPTRRRRAIRTTHHQPAAAVAQQQRQRDVTAAHQQQPPPQQQQPQAQRQQKDNAKFKEQIESIVQEEREAKGKMPTYKGLENYQLLDKMGDGAFSNVYKAIDLRTGQKVAVKVVRKYELSASQAGDKHLNREFKKKPRVTERANILKEVQIMRGTNHPSIVKLYGFFEAPDYYFLILELLEGGELFHQIVKLTYFSENLARHVILQVAQGIRYLHEERGVVHRDIKPENLLFEQIPVVPSKNPPRSSLRRTRKTKASSYPASAAEVSGAKVVWDEQTMTQIVKDERYSKSVDMWALGCVLYTLLCGFPPFYDESINVLTEKVARGHYTFLSPWWDSISTAGLDNSLTLCRPSQRYTIDEFLAHPWCTAAPGPPPPPTPLPAAMPLDSPLLASARIGEAHGMRSPGLAQLKEAFDVTYAVHRMEEEGARRRAQKGGANRGFLNNLNEDDEEEEQPPTIARRQQPQQQTPATAGQAGVGAGAKAAAKRAVAEGYDGRAGPRDRGRNRQQPFELDMDGATLLGRRTKRGTGGPADVSSPLAKILQQPKDLMDVPGSPMRID
ncbi:kinase-like domain-containing protein [Fomitopsis serialis]|uniref:kinase-like domain-containing protein n=1 Tax=Fomitopsis serialis TaxID=139415 RepID=UPI00200738F0|nr:kinase-like domain-containing protein [Neoantrodia serialis]KAH9938670.1 kinase-like domain-containing protein [Neoantrodia serialis]